MVLIKIVTSVISSLVPREEAKAPHERLKRIIRLKTKRAKVFLKQPCLIPDVTFPSIAENIPLSTTNLSFIISRYNKGMDIMDSKEAAKILGISVTRLRELAQDGLVGTKIGRQWIFTRAEVKAFKEKPRRGRGRPRKG